jgi:hypothetical protein
MSQESQLDRIGIQTGTGIGNRAVLVLKKEIQFAPVLQEKREIFSDVSNPKKFIAGIRNGSLDSQRTGYEISRQNLNHSAEHLQFISDRDFLAPSFRNEVSCA